MTTERRQRCNPGAGGPTRSSRGSASRSRRWGLYYVKGRFRHAQARIELPSQGEPRAEPTIAARSIHTRIPPRDMHLRSRQFLDVTTHLEIRFRSERAEPLGDGHYRVHGELMIRGVRGPVELQAQIEFRDDGTAHLRLNGAINRHDFNIRPPQPFEMIVGDEVRIDVHAVARPE